MNHKNLLLKWDVDFGSLCLSLELSEKERLNIHKMLQAARNFIEAAVFDTAKVQAVVKLEKEWIQYLKKDLKAFLE